jgi:hypothetical protein
MSAAEIDEYLQCLDEPQRSTLSRLRRDILAVVPGAGQCISYGVPGLARELPDATLPWCSTITSCAAVAAREVTTPAACPGRTPPPDPDRGYLKETAIEAQGVVEHVHFAVVEHADPVVQLSNVDAEPWP